MAAGIKAVNNNDLPIKVGNLDFVSPRRFCIIRV
jgi:hypothetical protein